ncbi:MAG TPA: class I SAM-dependent methyltransferase [Parachlamydiaceae bacterium]|nr:class I SAM-dependent methyltransferase [Parachlamydiaceae bacterium]
MNLANKRQQFLLFQTPLDLAHAYWQKLLKPGDCVIDATCGNGHDTLFLSGIVLDMDNSAAEKKGYVIAIDTQEQAIENTRNLLNQNLPKNLLDRISLHQQCHSSFPPSLRDESVNLVVYNLGYLPGGDKALTTVCPTTIKSLKAATPLIAPGGAICITCYPGHAAGVPEEEMALEFAASLDPHHWSSCHHRWVNRRNAPSLILIQRGCYPT